MKSIREWMVEKGMTSIMEDDMNRSLYVRSKEGSLEVDSILRSKVNEFVDRLKKMSQYHDLSDMELANKLHDAVDAVIADVSGSRVSAGKAFDKIYGQDDPIAKEP